MGSCRVRVRNDELFIKVATVLQWDKFSETIALLNLAPYEKTAYLFVEFLYYFCKLSPGQFSITWEISTNGQISKKTWRMWIANPVIAINIENSVEKYIKPGK